MAIIAVSSIKAREALKPARVPTLPGPEREPAPEREQPKSAAQDSAPDQPNYTVGYGKPPVHTRFKPGQSGNPKGRPRSAKGIKTIVREALTQKVTVRTANGEKRITRIEALLQKNLELAAKGNPRALADVLKLYAAAVPDLPASSSETPQEELSATDLAIMEALKAHLLSDEGASQ